MVWATYWAPWNPTLGRQVSLASRTKRRAERSLESIHQACTYACLILKQGREGRLKLHGLLASFPQPSQHMPQPKLRHRSSPLLHYAILHWGEGCPGLEEISAMRYKSSSDLQRCLSRTWVAITGLYTGVHQKWSKSLTVAGPLQPVPWPTLNTFTSASYSSIVHLKGEGASAGGKITYKENGVTSDLNLRASAPAMWNPTLPPVEQWQPLSRGEALADTWLWP